MRTYKFSKLKDKPEHRLRALMAKEVNRIRKLNSLLTISKEFNIPLNSVIIDDINNKIKYCLKEKNKILDL